MSWMQHLAVGFRELGHETSIVSSTKSGRSRSSWGDVKWGAHWSVYTPSVVVKDEQLAEALDAFDLVVLPEPKVPAADKEGMKFKDRDGNRVSPLLPVYVDVLQRTKTPFIFALHGNDYDAKSAPFMHNLMVQDNWTGTVISHSERSVASNMIFQHSGVRVIPSALPYVPSRGIQTAREYTNTVGTTGRFIFNKGPHLVALSASQVLPTDVTVELWGAASAGLGASHTYTTYEELLPQAEKYLRYGDQDAKRGQPGWTEHGNIIRPFPWDMRLKTGQLVRYLGSYTDAVGVAERLSVHVNLTGFKFSGGLVEYSTLEAMDAGCVCVAPKHVSAPGIFETLEVAIENPPGSPTAALKQPELLTTVAESITAATSFATSKSSDVETLKCEMVERNRESLRSYNSPRAVAEKFIEGAFGK